MNEPPRCSDNDTPASPEAKNRRPTPGGGLNPPSCDILIFIATSSEEIQLSRAASDLQLGFKKAKFNKMSYFDLGVVGATRVFAVRTRMGALTHTGSAYKANYFKTLTGATGLITVGMAFGVNPKIQRPGQILVSRSVLPYDDRDVLPGYCSSTYSFPRVEPHLASPPLIAMCERFAQNPKVVVPVQFGALLSGAARVGSIRYRDNLVRKLQPKVEYDIIGGEMEAFGLLSVSPLDDPQWVVIKAISDFADRPAKQMKDADRDEACYASCFFSLGAIKADVPSSAQQSGGINVAP